MPGLWLVTMLSFSFGVTYPMASAVSQASKVLGFGHALRSLFNVAVPLSLEQGAHFSRTQQPCDKRRKRLSQVLSVSSAAFTPSSTGSKAATAAIDPEDFDIPPFRPTPASDEDIACIEQRQLGHPITCAGGPRQRCAHGFSQAFIFHPTKTTFNSGLFRLSCPLLVKAVDEFEAQGGLQEFNRKLEKSPAMQREFRRVNARHSAIRRGLVDPEGLRSYVEKLGEAGVEQILASGIAGVSPTKTGDLKCLHAHLADYLCTHDNAIGEEVYEHLRTNRQIEVEGNAECWQQCNLSFERTPSSWWYVPVKNKQKLRSRYHRRTARRREHRERGVDEYGDGEEDARQKGSNEELRGTAAG